MPSSARARFLVAVVSGALVALASPRARADSHEGVTLFPPTGSLRVGAETETAGFVIGGRRGSFVSGIPRLELTPIRMMNLRVRVPFHSLALDGESDARTGLGDVEMRLRLNLKGGEPIRFNAGWVIQMPTGSKHAGVGEGAMQVTPFVSSGVRFGQIVVYLTLADTLSLASVHAPRLQNWVDPSADHEARATLGTIVPLTEVVSAGAFFTDTTILTSVNRFSSIVNGGVQVGAQPDQRVRLVVSEQIPLLGQHRFEWKLNAALTYSL